VSLVLPRGSTLGASPCGEEEETVVVVVVVSAERFRSKGEAEAHAARHSNTSFVSKRHTRSGVFFFFSFASLSSFFGSSSVSKEKNGSRAKNVFSISVKTGEM